MGVGVGCLCPHFGLPGHFCPQCSLGQTLHGKQPSHRVALLFKGTARDNQWMPASFVGEVIASFPPGLLRASQGALSAPRTHLSPPEMYLPDEKAGHELRQRCETPPLPIRDQKPTVAWSWGLADRPLCCRFCSKVDPGPGRPRKRGE